MAAAAPAVISDDEQQNLIAEELGLPEDIAFRQFLSRVWPRWSAYGELHPLLPYLYVKREGILYLMGRYWLKRDIKMGDLQRKDHQVSQHLQMMLNAIQDDINVTVNRTQSRPSVSATIVSGAISSPAAGPIRAAAPALTQTTTTTGKQVTVTEKTPPLTDWSDTIREGGMSQRLMPAREDRTYFRLSPVARDVYWSVAVDATMGPSSNLLRGQQTLRLVGDDAPTEEIFIVGETTGQFYMAFEG